MRTHELKTWPEPFAALVAGVKRYEVRPCHDRVFAVGDLLVLREYDPRTKNYSGRSVSARVIHMTKPGDWGLPDDVCVLGLGVTATAVR